MDIFSFHLMPWPSLPESYDGPSWITMPNSLYDPVEGSRIMNEYFDQLVSCEALGFDGVGVNEHHQTAWGSMTSPNLAAGMILARTQTLKVLVLGPALPLYSPLRIAEELAMLDVMSKGRILAGSVIGGPPEYYNSGMNPTEARGRFNESLELIIKAWTTPGPFEWAGEYYNFQYVNPWPTPYQKPHPPIWVPGAGSVETIEMCVDREYNYSALPFLSRTITDKSNSAFRERWVAAGKAPNPGKLSLLLPIYVAETDEKARAEFEEHFWYFNRRLTKGGSVNTPGYMSEKSMLRIMSAMDGFAQHAQTWEDVERAGFVITGSPNTVVEKLLERIDETGAGNLLGMFQLGSMPHAQVMANLQLFSEEVMPKVRATFPNGPTWREAR